MSEYIRAIDELLGTVTGKQFSAIMVLVEGVEKMERFNNHLLQNTECREYQCVKPSLRETLKAIHAEDVPTEAIVVATAIRKAIQARVEDIVLDDDVIAEIDKALQEYS